MLKTQQQPAFHLASHSLVASTIHEDDESEGEQFETPAREARVQRPLVENSSNNNTSCDNPQAKPSTLKRSRSSLFTSFNTTPKQPVPRAPSARAEGSGADGSSSPARATKDGLRERRNESNQDKRVEGQGEGAHNGDEAREEEPAEAHERVEDNFSAPLVWRNIILFVILHSSIPIGVRMLANGQVAYKTLLWSLVGIYVSGLGVTGGAHRLWSHRAYKARWPVQLLLMLLQTMAGQNSIYTWSRDHRVHHKFSETNADPHNIKRGFFFAHMGWLCCRKHPDVREKGAVIDMSDLEANPIVMFQHRHFWWLAALFTVLVPSYLPVLLWGENFWVSFTFSFMLRYLITLHGTWLVNSAAHYFGSRPYDRRIEARESPFVILTGLGEGFHNYHHTFPYDYSTSEFGKYFNITTAFIDLCARLGLVHERRSMSRAVIEQRQQRTGDGSASGPLKEKHMEEERGAAAEQRDSAAASSSASSSERLVNNLIHELPYISGLTTMKYTM